MNKKGFTLTEILVSIVLLTSVLYFVFNTLVKLKNIYVTSDSETDIALAQSSIISFIENDIKKHNGVSSINCDSTLECDIELSDETYRTIKINTTEGKEGVIYLDDEENVIYIRSLYDDNKYDSITSSFNNNIYKLTISATNSYYNIEMYFYTN